MWRDEQEDRSNLRLKIISTLEKHQRADSCQALITKLRPITNIAGSPTGI